MLRREALIGLAILLLVAAPNLVWQWQHHWPTIDFLHRLRLQNGPFDPDAFLAAPLTDFFRPTVAVWGVGLVALLLRRRTRYLGLTYVLFIPLMLALQSKSYYTHPIYPLLFAAGAVAWEKVLSFLPRVRIIAFSSACLALGLYSLYLLPMTLPVFTPATWLRYAAAIDFYKPPADPSLGSTLPPFYADRFGWQEEANEVTRLVGTLSPGDRASLIIFCDNYGEAGALQILAPSLPPVVSGQVTYFLWGYGNATGETVLAVTKRSADELHQRYRQVELVGNLDGSLYMELYERRVNIYLLRGPRQPIADLWPKLKT